MEFGYCIQNRSKHFNKVRNAAIKFLKDRKQKGLNLNPHAKFHTDTLSNNWPSGWVSFKLSTFGIPNTLSFSDTVEQLYKALDLPYVYQIDPVGGKARIINDVTMDRVFLPEMDPNLSQVEIRPCMSGKNSVTIMFTDKSTIIPESDMTTDAIYCTSINKGFSHYITAANHFGWNASQFIKAARKGRANQTPELDLIPFDYKGELFIVP